MTCATWTTRSWWSPSAAGTTRAARRPGAVEHLAEIYEAESVFAIDPDDFYDFQVNRPAGASSTRTATASWSGRPPRCWWPTCPTAATLVLVHGLEPNLRWRQFCTLITSALTSASARRVHLLGALLADTPHTRPIPVSTSTGDRELMTRLGLAPSTYEGPTGIVGVLADAAGAQRGRRCSSLWAAVPHYVSHPPCPKATLALLSQLEQVLDTPLELGELPELARAWERGVDELAAEDSEVAEYVDVAGAAAGRDRAARGQR